MRKYLAISSTLFKTQIIYRFDVVMTALELITRVLFAWILWGAIFTDKETVGVFTFKTMLLYYVIASFLSSLDISGGVSEEISDRIRNGTFSKYMIIPINVQYNFLAQNMGAAAYYAIYSIIVAIGCFAIFQANFLFTINPILILFAFICIILGLIFMTIYHFLIGILSFKFQNSGFFLHINSAFLEFITGSIVPLTLLSEPVIEVIRFLPFPHIVYTPTMLLLGKVDIWEGLTSIIVLIGWTVGIIIVNEIIYSRLRKKYDGVGI